MTQIRFIALKLNDFPFVRVKDLLLEFQDFNENAETNQVRKLTQNEPGLITLKTLNFIFLRHRKHWSIGIPQTYYL